MDFRETFRVEPGKKCRLSDVDPNQHGKHESEEKARADLDANKLRIAALQRKLYGEGKRSILIILQGMDSAGKDGTLWHVLSALDPLGVHVTDFKQPTPQEKAHDFLWRVHPHTPGKGEIAIFNRSHYESVLVERVHNLVDKAIWKARYDAINAFEHMLHHDNQTVILKFFLHISKDEQLRRFEQRLDDPARQWKISEADYKERGFWDDYIEAYEAALAKCTSEDAPWYVIPANHKWFRNLAVSQILAETMEDLHLQLPEPRVDLAEIRKLYHAAVKDKPGSKSKGQK